ncbi:MAG: tetratricopeptide repeat protein, partial [Phycisphaerales bacterium]
AVAGARRVLGEKHWITSAFIGNYGETLAALQRYEEAEAALLEAVELTTAVLGPDDERAVEQIESLIALYTAWHEAEPDTGHDAKAAEWRAKLDQLNTPAIDRRDSQD